MHEMTPQHLLDSARLHHQAGRLREAAALYRQFLAQEPNHADALHLLGYAMFQSRRPREGFELIRRAIALDGGRAEYHCHLAVVLGAMNQHAEAIAACKQALALRPEFAEAAYHLAGSLLAVGDAEQAIAMYRQALALRPDWPEAHMNLGNALHAADQLEDAVAAFQQALAQRPRLADAAYNLGNALWKLQRPDEAMAALKQALAIKSNYPQAYNNLGNVLTSTGQFQEAVAAFRKALQLRPTFSEVYNNLANALSQLGKFDDAIMAYGQAMKRRPDDANVHFNMGTSLLRLGRFEDGWPHHEWRWRVEEFHQRIRQFDQPMWDGSDLKGKRILLHAEQGFGDAIQFARYAQLVARRSGKVIVECQAKLARLFRSLPAIEELIVAGQPLPPFDVHCPFLSVPYVLGTTVQTIPADVPYLGFDVALAQQWRQRMGDVGDELKVGLVWAGRRKPLGYDPAMPLAQFARLGRVSGVRFYSLQTGPPAEQARQPPAGMDLVDWAADLSDFADTAALMANLNLIITVDTAAAHLAGALARPVWLLLRYVPDWRWMLDRTDSPWYPTMRLFRQPRPGDWETPVQALADQLRAEAQRS